MTKPQDRPIPDRLSVTEPSYDSEFGRRLSITVDGVQQVWVREYCTSEGWVKRLVRETQGHSVTRGALSDPEEETVKGTVVVTVKP